MLTTLAAFIEHTIISLGAVGVFIGAVMEEVIVPIPSSLVQAGAGFFLLAGEPVSVASIWKLITWIAIPSAVGVVVGSLLIYFLVYYGGMPAIRKFGKYFLLDPEKIEKTRADIAQRPSIIITITALRFIPLLPNAVITATAGLLRIPFWKYVWSTLIGVFIRALYLGSIGWLTGRVTDASDPGKSFYAKIGILFVVLIAMSIIVGLLMRYVRNRKKRNKNIQAGR
jgi:membrane protein DedA with SNARE-associated domain